MKLPLVLKSIRDYSYDTVYVTVTVGIKDYNLALKREDTDNNVKWNLYDPDGYGQNRIYLNELLSIKEISNIEVDDISTMSDQIELAFIEHKNLLKAKKDEEYAKIQAKREETRVSMYNSIKTSNVYSTYEFDVTYDYSLDVTIYHPKNKNVMVQIRYDKDVNRWKADYTTYKSYGQNSYRTGNKVNRKNFFGTEMQQFIKDELDVQYRNYLMKNSDKIIRTWLENNKEKLEANGYNIPYEYDNYPSKHTLTRKIDDNTTEFITVSVHIDNPENIMVSSIKTITTIVNTPDQAMSDQIIKNMLISNNN